jgi:hypothetical protein
MLPLLGMLGGSGGGMPGFTGGAATSTATSGPADQRVEGRYGSSGRRGNIYSFGGDVEGGNDWLPWVLGGGVALVFGALFWSRWKG